MARRGGTVAGLPARAGAVAVAPRRAPQATDIRASYYQRLEHLVSRATDAFQVSVAFGFYYCCVLYLEETVFLTLMRFVPNNACMGLLTGSRSQR